MSETKQPIWKKVGVVGDVNPIDYDGGFVYEDTTGVYPPEIEYIINVSDTDEGPWRVYRWPLDPPRFKTLTAQGKSEGTYYKGPLVASERGDTWYWYNEWYVKSLPEVASSCGTTALHMLRELFSKNLVRRAMVQLDIAQYHGFENFDSYPLDVSDRAELETRIELKPLETKH